MIGKRRDKRDRSAGLVVALVTAVVAFPSAALAHSELESSRPADGSRPKKPPEHIVLNFSETPAKDSVVRVADPCTKNLVGDSFVAGNAFHVQVDGGTGGKYQVEYSLISAEDGHPTKGTFSFTVKGPADCSADEPKDDPADDGEGDSAGAPDADPAGDEEESSSPIVPIALGGLGLIAIAALARFATRK